MLTYQQNKRCSLWLALSFCGQSHAVPFSFPGGSPDCPVWQSAAPAPWGSRRHWTSALFLVGPDSCQSVAHRVSRPLCPGWSLELDLLSCIPALFFFGGEWGCVPRLLPHSSLVCRPHPALISPLLSSCLGCWPFPLYGLLLCLLASLQVTPSAREAFLTDTAALVGSKRGRLGHHPAAGWTSCVLQALSGSLHRGCCSWFLLSQPLSGPGGVGWAVHGAGSGPPVQGAPGMLTGLPAWVAACPKSLLCPLQPPGCSMKICLGQGSPPRTWEL